MQDTDAKPSERVLDPIARVSEILFGLIMALTFTGTLGARRSHRPALDTSAVKSPSPRSSPRAQRQIYLMTRKKDEGSLRSEQPDGTACTARSAVVVSRGVGITSTHDGLKAQGSRLRAKGQGKILEYSLEALA